MGHPLDTVKVRMQSATSGSQGLATVFVQGWTRNDNPNINNTGSSSPSRIARWQPLCRQEGLHIWLFQ